MGNEVAKPVFGGNVGMVNPDKLLQDLANSAAKDPRGGTQDGSDYMNFSGKVGKYEIGTDKLDADPEEAWIVDVTRFEDGWICWKGGRPVATRLYPLGTEVPEPNFDEHGPFTRDEDGWYQAKSMVAKSIDTGQQVYFKNNSVSGVSEFARVQKAVIARLRAGQASWPVIHFKKEGFTAKGYKNFKPIFEIEGWLKSEQLPRLMELMEGDKEFDLTEFYAEGANISPVGGDVVEATADVDDAEVVEETPKVARRNKRL